MVSCRHAHTVACHQFVGGQIINKVFQTAAVYSVSADPNAQKHSENLFWTYFSFFLYLYWVDWHRIRGLYLDVRHQYSFQYPNIRHAENNIIIGTNEMLDLCLGSDVLVVLNLWAHWMLVCQLVQNVDICKTKKYITSPQSESNAAVWIFLDWRTWRHTAANIFIYYMKWNEIKRARQMFNEKFQKFNSVPHKC